IDGTGEKHYRQIFGRRVIAKAESGEPLEIPAAHVAAVTAARMKSGFNKAFGWIADGGRYIKTTLLKLPPEIRDVAKKAAVAIPTGLLTYYIIRPVNFRHFFIEDYVENLEQNGVSLEDFFDLQKLQAQAAARLPIPQDSVLETIEDRAERAGEGARDVIEDASRSARDV